MAGLVRRMPRLPTAAITPLHRCQSIRLTPREREVLGLMVEGLTNREIGEALVIDRNTVKNHVARILDKFGAVNRTQAVARAVARGLVVPDGEG